MNKIKFIIPLFVAPVLFGCNKGIAGNYVIDEKVEHSFTVGKETDYEKEDHSGEEPIFPAINNIKSQICNDLILYSDGKATEDKAVHITDEFGRQIKTKSGETIETKAVNVKNVDEDTKTIAFEWGKEKTGYHFYANRIGHVDYLCIYEKISTSTFSEPEYIWIGDNGFTVSGNTLTSKFIAKIEINNQLKYQIEFTVTAKK